MVCNSASPSGRRRYTRARDSSAEFSSKAGFSVVAPIRVSVPSSTKGRKASCCALLKRCTSSTNSTHWRPAARSARPAATASRMALTPSITADRDSMRLCAAAHSRRARVVLPTPGGPHRIMECSGCASRQRRRGLPGASRWLWPTKSSARAGRSSAARGCAGAGVVNSSLFMGVEWLLRSRVTYLTSVLRALLDAATARSMGA